MSTDNKPFNLLTPGHNGCAGCCDALAAKYVLMAVGSDCIIVNPTGCLEVMTTPFPKTAWNVPWIHSLFENGGAVASGVEAALIALGRKNNTKVIGIGGDGSTMDIGIGALSGAFERGHDITYVCIDNEAYMNTGVQRSSGTPFGASTTTSPFGKASYGNATKKKDMPAIMAAHGSPYVATTSIGYANDMIKKVKKATDVVGPTYIHAHAPCPTGWGFDSSKTIEIAKLAVDTCLWPLFEMEDGVVTSVKKVKDPKPVEDYLKTQSRFKHLFKMEGGAEEIKKIQAMADKNIAFYGLDK
ncbi:Oxalate oxidoreductase subunit beta [Methanosarcinaceae archaeon Ag5]|uniref:Oxalate oxidoreductase subunit beta n=1 Tax=Methanolapillus africanus TaxID=3028297 RepID=A0AAE4SDW1_9EURY|nr:Oxalate oxidoreductase subunit beta [Methanosarcinaceae archaeon Ag5]